MLPLLLTYGDLIDHLDIWIGGGLEDGSEQRKCRLAVQNAYRQVAQEHRWHYFTREERINAVAPYTTGTVATSGTTVTLTTGTWPAWARYGRILFDDDRVVYRVASRTSDSAIELDPNFYPSTNVTAGTTFKIYRAVYPLPAGCLLQNLQAQDYLGGTYVESDQWHSMQWHLNRSGSPWFYTIMGGGDFFASQGLYLHGYPSAATTFSFLYQAPPRELNFDGHERYSSQGDSTLATASGTSATFGNISLRADIAGSVLRIGSAGETERPRGLGDTNQYAAQQIIATRVSGSEVTLINNIALGKTSDEFSISDPVDYPSWLISTLQRRCEYELALIMGDTKRANSSYTLYERELKRSMAAGSAPAEPSGYGQRPPWVENERPWIIKT